MALPADDREHRIERVQVSGLDVASIVVSFGCWDRNPAAGLLAAPRQTRRDPQQAAESAVGLVDAQSTIEQATFMAGELLIPLTAAERMAFDDWDNARVATAYGVSEQFAQMQMKGERVRAQRAASKYGFRSPTGHSR